MRGVVYVDILVLVNGVIAAFLLRCTARLCSCQSPGLRLLAAGVLAGLSSLVLLLPPLPAAAVWALKLAGLASIVAMAFPWQGMRWYLRAVFWYVALNMLLSGAVLAAVYYGAAGSVETNNLTIYFNISPLGLVGCVTTVYLAMRMCLWSFGRPAAHPAASFAVWFGTRQVCGMALLDTGLSLHDPVTGEEAFLLSYPALAEKLPAELSAKLLTYFQSGRLEAPLRLVPAQTAAGIRALPAARADRLLLQEEGRLQAQRATLAVFTNEALGGGQFGAAVAAAPYGTGAQKDRREATTWVGLQH